MGSNALRSRRGFSLTEALVSLALLSTVVTAFLTSVDAAMRGSRHQQRSTQAIELLDGTTEALLMRNPSDPLLEPGVHEQTYDRNGLPCSGSDALYKISWTVSIQSSDVSMRELVLRISWKEGTAYHSIGWTTWRS